LNEIIEGKKLSEAEALMTFVQFAKLRGKHPVLIIDEANKVLGLGDGVTASSSTLDAIVRLTKESKEMDVIMASSEYGYPYLLEDNGLNLNDISQVLFAGEIPPKSIWELLVTKESEQKAGKPLIGMGENLARLLIASYGGHFLRIFSAVRMLRDKKEFFSADMCLNPISENITLVMESFPQVGLKLLREMAETGFAPVTKMRDPCVELIVRANIGGLVSKSQSKVVGVPETMWKDDEATALVPTSESARNLIAMKVLFMEKKRREEQERRWWNRLKFWRRKQPH
jgi:hypothetical protein